MNAEPRTKHRGLEGVTWNRLTAFSSKSRESKDEAAQGLRSSGTQKSVSDFEDSPKTT